MAHGRPRRRCRMPLCPDRHVRVAAEHLRRHLPRTQVHHLDRPPRPQGRVHERSGQSRRRGHRRQRQLLQRQNLRTGHLRPARQKNRGTHHPRGDVAHQRRHRLQGPQGTPDGDFPVRHDAVRRRGAPLPLGAGRRPGADRRRQGGRIHLREQLLHPPPSPDADRQAGRRHGGDGRDRRAFQRPGRRRDHR